MLLVVDKYIRNHSTKKSYGSCPVTKISIKQKVILIFFGFFLSFVLIETVLRTAGFVFGLYYEKKHYPTDTIGQTRILCLGESTTAGLYHRDCFPEILQQVLYKRNRKYRVINKGRGGTNTAVISSELEEMMKLYNPHYVVLMMGINDNARTIVYDQKLADEIILFFQDFKVYKLVTLLWDRIFFIHQQNGLETKKNENIGDGLRRQNAVDGIDLTPELIKPDYYSKAFDYFMREEYQKAEDLLSKGLADINDDKEVPPDTIKSGKLLFETFLKMGKFKEAENLCKLAAAHNATISDWTYCYLLIGQKKYEDLEQFLLKKQKDGHADDLLYQYNQYLHIKIREKDYALSEKLAEIALKTKIPLIPLHIREFKKINAAQEQYKNFLLSLGSFINNNPEFKDVYTDLQIFFNNAIAADNFTAAKSNPVEQKNHYSAYYLEATRKNYQRICSELLKKDIRVICMQYPLRSIKPLKDLLEPIDGLIFVSNEDNFKSALHRNSYWDYFIDDFANDFGHCTHEGDRIIAENLAQTILELEKPDINSKHKKSL